MITKRCPDCAVDSGELHGPNCDVERCPNCGGQALMCNFCADEGDVGDIDINDDSRLPWEGEWPGVKECEEFDLWVLWDPPNGPNGTGWVKCKKETPGAVHDLNSLAIMKWDKNLRKHVR